MGEWVDFVYSQLPGPCDQTGYDCKMRLECYTPNGGGGGGGGGN